MILDLFIYIIQFYINQNTFLPGFIIRKRIEHAVYLLSSTDMQIQNIAQYCGIPDVNYFTKIFKKVMNKTPSEFKEEIR